MLAEIRFAPVVVGNFFRRTMRCTVDFNHEPKRQTGEVGNVGTNWVLSANSYSVHCIAAKPRPEDHLRVRHSSPQRQRMAVVVTHAFRNTRRDARKYVASVAIRVFPHPRSKAERGGGAKHRRGNLVVPPDAPSVPRWRARHLPRYALLRGAETKGAGGKQWAEEVDYSAAITRSASASVTETSWLTPRSAMVTPNRRSMRDMVSA